MPFKLPKPDIRLFYLDRTDKFYKVPAEERTYVKIKLANARENEIRGQIFSEYVREIQLNDAPGMERVIMKLPLHKLGRIETFLTLVDTNIVEEEDKPMFKFSKDGNGYLFLDMSESAFTKQFGKLPTLIIDEIHEKVLEANEHWTVGPTTSEEDVSLGEESSLQD